MNRFIALFSLIFLIPLMLYSANVAPVASSRDIAPVSLVKLKGGAGGQPVANLAIQDQSGAADTSSKYVAFITPGTIYQGYSRFIVPANIPISSVTSMKVKVNYKGLPKASQRWSFSLYDWSAKKWVYVGDNTGAKNNLWFAATFSTTLPKRFISAGREIHLLLQSNNATGNAKLDFENINITYAASPTPSKTSGPVTSSSVYGDALVNGWGDWSWDLTPNLDSASPVHSGAKAIAVTYTIRYSGLQFGLSDPLDVSDYETLRFWIHGGNSGGQTVQVQIKHGNTVLATKYVTPQAGVWKQEDVSVSNLSQVDMLAWFNDTDGGQSTFYLDDVAFVGSGGPTLTPTRTLSGPTPTRTLTPPPSAGPALSVDVGVDRHDISPYIYGMNFAAQALADELDLPVNRWGGNSTSRYNWQTGNTNAGSDWFYENKSDGNHTDWINQNVATGADSIITVPMMGYVAKNGSTSTCGFNVLTYGPQQKTDSYSIHCGNGILSSNGNKITGNDPLDTSIVFNQNNVKSWVQSLVSAYGLAADGGVRFYDLDNEPELWSETHRDIHPTPQSYDEIYNKGVTYAAAIKEADPGAKTLGFVGFGWSGYWYSMRDMVAGAANGYSYFPDYATHGNLPQVPWYLSQMKQYEIDHGIRLLDYLDLHYYPENGVALSAAGDTNKQALRLRSTSSLWDPTYIDESWIGDENQAERSVHIIPRMRDWVNTYYPGTKLAMTEYNFGGLEALNGALAQADVLGIFGREGLDLATLWDPPTASQPGAYAFRIYRNYDGNHNGFGDTSVHAASADQEKLAVYAAQRSSGDSALTVVVINKTGGALTSNLALAGFTPSGNAQVYRYTGTPNAIQHLSDQAVSASGFSATYPANSITLLVIPGSAP